MKRSILIMVLVSSFLMANSSYKDSGAAEALKGLDCEFEDCTPHKPEIKIVEKVVEKVVYKDRPVEVIKEVPVEKVVYRDRPVVTVKEVSLNKAPILKKEVSTSDITFNKAYFDIHTKTQAPILDYITYTKDTSFDVTFFADSVSKIKENGIDAYIYGKILVPSSIDTNQVYMYVGEKYDYNYYGYWSKHIQYNKGANQNADYFLTKVYTDNEGRRYVSYKISIHLDKPSKINPAEKNVAPNTYFFKMAPKVRGFKNKFISTKIYIINQ